MQRQNPGNRQLADAFESIKLKSPEVPPFREGPAPRIRSIKRRQELPATSSLGVEGVDHINTHFHSTTDLGRALSVYGNYPFNHPEYGRFKTVHGLLCWLGNPNQPDWYRTASAISVENHRLMSDRVTVKNYRLVMMEAIWLKIKAHPEIGRQLVASELRLEHYYIQALDPNSKKSKKIRIRPDSAAVVLRSYEEIRNALIEGRSPCFSFILNESERAAYLKKLARECETLNVALTPSQERKPVENKDVKPVKKFSPSEKRYRKKFFDKVRASQEDQASELVRTDDGSMEHRSVPVQATEPTVVDSTPDNSGPSQD